jgi:NTE family protein
MGYGVFQKDAIPLGGRGKDKITEGKIKMIAFVLSGGGSRGAFEVGAIRALLAHGIQPDMLVGSSAGAMNATGLALVPTLAGVDRLQSLWLKMDEDDFFSSNPLVTALRLVLKRPGLYSNQRMYRLVLAEVQHQARCFADISDVHLYLTAVGLENGELHVFGDDPGDSVVDAIMASTAIQPYFEPWSYQGHCFADGGLISNLPLLVALERGATEIYTLDVTLSSSGKEIAQDLFGLLRQEAYLVIDQMRKQELLRARAQLGNRLHHIHYPRFPGLMPFDFSHTAEMIADGKMMVTDYLDRLNHDHNPIKR